MIKDDKVYGKPLVQYTGTQSQIEALTGLDEGSIAYATDIDKFGSYNGSVWTWVTVATTRFEILQDSVGSILTDSNGINIMYVEVPL